MNTTQHAAESAAAAGLKVTTTMTHGGAVAAIYGGWTLQEWAIIGGFAVSVVGLLGGWVIQWYWKAKDHALKREQIEFDRRRAASPIEFDDRRAR